MDKRYRRFAQYIETFIIMPKDPERGFYNQYGEMTDAGLLCALNCLFKEGVFSTYTEIAIEYAKETGHFMAKNDISKLFAVG